MTFLESFIIGLLLSVPFFVICVIVKFALERKKQK